MEKITEFTGKAVVLDRDHVDTDQIIPKQFLKRIERTGFGQYLFFDWRFNKDGSERTDFELNDPDNKGATILIGGENFGCGSSREHAPWALGDYGFKVIIATSFADIFHQNCLQNGIIPIVLTKEKKDQLANLVKNNSVPVKVDLPNQTISAGTEFQQSFTIHPYWKMMMVNGWDEISLTLQYEEYIQKYEQMIEA